MEAKQEEIMNSLQHLQHYQVRVGDNFLILFSSERFERNREKIIFTLIETFHQYEIIT